MIRRGATVIARATTSACYVADDDALISARAMRENAMFMLPRRVPCRYYAMRAKRAEPFIQAMIITRVTERDVTRHYATSLMPLRHITLDYAHATLIDVTLRLPSLLPPLLIPL